MDLVTLATEVVAFLTPYLADAEHAAAKESGKKLLAALERKFKGKPAAEEALQDVREFPTDEDAQAALRQQLKKALRTDPIFRDELTTLWRSVSIQGDGNIVGDKNTVLTAGRDIIIADPDQLWRAIRHRPPQAELRRATEHYLRSLVARYRYLDFKGMGISDRVPLRLPLLDMYVPLKARVAMPRGETWARKLLVAGRSPSEEEQEAIGERVSEPRPVLDILRQNNGLVILGDPGSGKTTFLKYLALRLASGDDLGLGLRLPSLVPLSAYANELAKREVRLDEFIVRYLYNRGADVPLDAMLEEALHSGGALILLDGLDEVRETGLRQTVAARVADFYTFHREGNLFVMTSRIVGYREVRPTVEGLVECTLVDFEDEEIESFVTKWTAALEREARGETTTADWEARREREELLAAMRNNPGVRGLAANPLLLTILALMKRQGVTLPERRVELYDQYIRVLLASWNRARGLGRPPARDLDVLETVRVLAPLALWMHRRNPGVGLVKRGDLQRELERIYRERGEEDPERSARLFLADVREYAGLLLERGAGQYGFIHLTFEEYLAAVGISRLGQRDIKPVVDILASHVDEPAWREISLLTIGYLGVVLQWDEVAGDVVLALLERSPGKAGQAVLLAGDVVVDSWPGGVPPACKEAVVQALLDTMRDWERVKPALRAAAGRTLARLGDPRFDPHRWYLPDDPLLGFVRIPAGEFLMGTRAQDIPVLLERFGGKGEWYELETPQHKVFLPEYYIARYPVTVAQWRAFVEDSGHQPKVARSLRDPDNHPVRFVTWYEALAYCKWLEEKLRNLDLPGLGNLSGLRVTLPSEAEWEKAARGTDGRRYPWGDDPDPNRANCDDIGIGTTSAVGCFPGGASPYGVEEMSGNVWEWTRSLYKAYPYVRDDGRENLNAKDDPHRVVRGGSLIFRRSARCAARDGHDPGYRWLDLGFRVVLVASPSALDSDPLDSETLGL